MNVLSNFNAWKNVSSLALAIGRNAEREHWRCCWNVHSERDRTVPHEQRLVKTGNRWKAKEAHNLKKKTLIDCMRQTNFCFSLFLSLYVMYANSLFFFHSRHLASLSARDNDQFMFWVECGMWYVVLVVHVNGRISVRRYDSMCSLLRQ